jgi:hypothetical protein
VVSRLDRNQWRSLQPDPPRSENWRTGNGTLNSLAIFQLVCAPPIFIARDTTADVERIRISKAASRKGTLIWINAG